MSLNESDVRGFVAAGVAWHPRLVLPGNAQISRPADPYATVLLLTDERHGFPNLVEVDDVTVIMATPRRATFSVQFYRPGAVDAAYRFVDWCESPRGLAAMNAACFQVVFPVNVRRLDVIVGDAFEERAQTDLTIAYARERAHSVDTFGAYRGTVRLSGIGVGIEEQING